MTAEEITQFDDTFGKLEDKLIPVIADLEDAGHAVNASHFHKIIRSLDQRLEELRQNAHDEARIKLASSSAEAFANLVSGLSLGNIASDRFLDGGLVREYRELTAARLLCQSVLRACDADGRVRPSVDHSGGNTGRIFTAGFVQNIPLTDPYNLRRGFVASAGAQIVAVKFHQLELWVLAADSGDEELKQAIAGGVDLIGLIAGKLFRHRHHSPDEVRNRLPSSIRKTEAVLLAIANGQSAKQLSQHFKYDLEKAQQLMDDFCSMFPRVDDRFRRLRQYLEANGYVRDMFGAPCWLPSGKLDTSGRNEWRGRPWLRSMERKRALAERRARSFVIQSAAATVIKLAMIQAHGIYSTNDLLGRMILAHENELQFEVGDWFVDDFCGQLHSRISELSFLPFTFDVPLRVQIRTGPTWADLQPWHRSPASKKKPSTKAHSA